jgi:hypothetical protein
MQFKKIWKIREDIRSLLSSIDSDTKDVRGLSRSLGRLLNKKYKTRFKWITSPVLFRNHIVVSGDYADWEEYNSPITIRIHTHPDISKYPFSKSGYKSWTQFVQDLSECIMHEHVHMAQYKMHKSKKIVPKSICDHYNYYADSDEVDAYSWTLASEIADNGGMDYISKPRIDSPYWSYVNYVFPINNNIKKKLLKKTYSLYMASLEYK